MAEQKRNALKLPIFTDPDQHITARLLNSISLILVFSGLIGLAIFVFLRLHLPLILPASGFLIIIGSLIQILIRIRQLVFSSFLLVSLGWLGVGVLVLQTGGLRSPFIILYLISIITAGLLLGTQAAGVTALFSMLAALGFALSGQSSLARANVMPIPLLWIVYTLILAFTFILLVQFLSLQRQAFNNARENERKLAQHNYEIQEQQESLARRISERTAEISQYLLYLQMAADLNQIINAFPGGTRLLSEAADLLQKRLGLYYTGIFLVDQSGQWAVLQAGTGESGQSMLARHHQIEIGSGMIGWAIANARIRVASDVAVDAFRLPTPELPLTRSEAAIPMRSLGKVMGAITVQSTRPNHFSQELLTVVQNFADTLAAVVENSRLSAENEEMQKQGQDLQAATHRETLRASLGARGTRGLIYDRISITPMNGEASPEVRRVRQSGQILRFVQNDAPVAYVPIKVRDQIIGTLAFRKPNGQEAWTDAEARLLGQLAKQLGDAMESARLYQSIQQQAAQEQLISEVTSRMRETLDVDTVLRTAVEEIYQALQLDQVAIELTSREADLAA